MLCRVVPHAREPAARPPNTMVTPVTACRRVGEHPSAAPLLLSLILSSSLLSQEIVDHNTIARCASRPAAPRRGRLQGAIPPPPAFAGRRTESPSPAGAH